MLPDLFDDLLSVADKLISNGVCVLPKLMRGRENGKQYPQDYDNTQLERMSALLDKSKPMYTDYKNRQCCILQ